MARPRLAALSVDLDEIACYAAIHGVDMHDESHHAIYERALPRLSELFAREGVKATFFAIGSDLEHGPSRAALDTLARDGHEIANHSYSHFYDLTRRARGVVAGDIERGAAAIERATGKRPVGFRAPGYTITDETFEILEAQGYLYDSSVFPCPTYYAAKTLAIHAYKSFGRPSRSVVDDPRVLLAPADPYRRGAPYWQRGEGLLELPVGVTRDGTGRMPYIGTYVVLSGGPGARLLTEAIAGRPFVNLELHGIDASDAHDDGLTWLMPHQPDLRRRGRDKLAALESAITTLRRTGYELCTLEEAAREYAT